MRLRVRDLQLLWWQKPTIIAPVATIMATVVGVIWAISTGFFGAASRDRKLDNRDLELTRQRLQFETAVLEAKRDQQSALFMAETKTNRELIRKLELQISALTTLQDRQRATFLTEIEQHKITIADLEGRQAKLRAAISKLDQPRLTSMSHLRVKESRPNRPPDAFIMIIQGDNLGRDQGKAIVGASARCMGGPQRAFELGDVPAEIQEWFDSVIQIRISLDPVKKAALAFKNDPNQTDCTVAIAVTIERSDQRRSNQQMFEILAEDL